LAATIAKVEFAAKPDAGDQLQGERRPEGFLSFY
jgi:hypothetical protein